MPILISTPWTNRAQWKQLLSMRGIKVIDASEDSFDAAEPTFGLVWLPPKDLLPSLPSLKAISSMGAGVDAILSDPTALPENVPIVRIVDPKMSFRMATFVLTCVLNYTRRFDEYRDAQARGVWDPSIENRTNWDSEDVRVTVLGAGEMGLTTARLLVSSGFAKVRVWSRSGGRVTAGDASNGIGSLVGRPQLYEALRTTDVLVNLLPLTPETRGMINCDLLQRLPRGAAVVNAARGAHVVDEDLVAALDSGHVGKAYLDVFAPEPLPQTSPFWSHPRVRVFPHVSAFSNIDTSIDQIVENYRRAMAGEPLLNLVHLDRGY